MINNHNSEGNDWMERVIFDSDRSDQNLLLPSFQRSKLNA
jgi:hypothetical protein